MKKSWNLHVKYVFKTYNYTNYVGHCYIYYYYVHITIIIVIIIIICVVFSSLLTQYKL